MYVRSDESEITAPTEKPQPADAEDRASILTRMHTALLAFASVTHPAPVAKFFFVEQQLDTVLLWWIEAMLGRSIPEEQFPSLNPEFDRCRHCCLPHRSSASVF
jgi:hypothetical protein